MSWKKEDNLLQEDESKNERDLKYEDEPKNKDDLKFNLNPKMKTTSEKKWMFGFLFAHLMFQYELLHDDTGQHSLATYGGQQDQTDSSPYYSPVQV